MVALVVSPLTVVRSRFGRAVGAGAGLVALLLVNLAWLRRVFTPLARLSRTMREVDPLEPGSRVALEDADPEIAELTGAFNEMLERLESDGATVRCVRSPRRRASVAASRSSFTTRWAKH